MNPRSYPVPQFVSSAHLPATATLDDLESIRYFAGDVGDWARRILASARAPYLNRVTDSERRLPLGIVDNENPEVVVGLINASSQTWNRHEWETPLISARLLGLETIDLPPDDVAFVVRAFDEGADGVLLRAWSPQARLDRPVNEVTVQTAAGAAKEAEAKGYPKLPDTAKVVAVVDELDRNAVLELLAVLPGARVLRRHDGLWYPDKGWAGQLKSVKPPPVVALQAAIRQSVISQVDEATKGEPFEETGKPPKPRQPRAASGDFTGLVASLQERSDEAFCEFVVASAQQAALSMGLVADIGSPVSGMPGKLQKYWAFGKGAAKIRWGTPGAWTRCHRNLTKYVGPFRAKGTCTNLAKLRGGHGIATHVGD